VHDGRSGLVVHAVAVLTQAEGVVGVFVVGGREGGVEAAQAGEQRARSRQERARTIVDLAHVVEERVIGRHLALAEVAAVAVGEDDAPRLLKRAVRVQQLAPHRARALPLQRRQKREQPAGPRQRVVVEEDQHLAGGGRCTGICRRK
jgi:hypothetical protein